MDGAEDGPKRFLQEPELNCFRPRPLLDTTSVFGKSTLVVFYIKDSMKNNIYLTLFLSAVVVSGGCSSDMNTNSNTSRMNSGNMSNMSTASPSPGMSTANMNSNRSAMGDDHDFMTEADLSGMAEVELSKLAQTKAQNAELKKFAAMMVTDHTKVGSELKALGMKKDFKPATEMDSAHKSMMEKLKGLSGMDFDKAYAEAMMDDHEDAVDLFKSQAESGKDAEIKAFAAKHLPALQEHLRMITSIQGNLK